MKRFIIKVNEIQYEVEVEEVLTHSAETIQPVKAIKETVKTDKAVTEETKNIVASMPGTILKVNVNRGDSVKKGQVLLILEAMKMQNEIEAPFDGIIASISVETDKAVNAGDVMISLV